MPLNRAATTARRSWNRASLALSLALVWPSLGQAQFLYTTNNGAITITSYSGPGGAVAIPGLITGLPVDSIGPYAFYYAAGVTSVVVTNSVTNLGSHAFEGCAGLTNVTLPGSLASIGDAAFASCSRLTTVMIPAGVTNLGVGVFTSCANLSAIAVDPLNAVYGSLGGVLFDKSISRLLQCPSGKTGAYAIPSGVTNVASGAFEYCSGLSSITIPGRVTTIESWAFASCLGLTSLTIPSGVQTIGTRAFTSCTGLTNLSISSSVTSLASWTFASCAALTQVTIPNGVTNIGLRAFASCFSLTNVIIPSGVTSIGSWAFGSCTALTGVTIPANVTNIGSGPFAACAKLAAITVDPLNPAYLSVDGVLFNQGMTLLVQYPAGKTGNYLVPNPVTTIGDNAFDSCAGLTGITLGGAVTALGQSAFRACTGLVSVTIPNSVTNVLADAFDGCGGLTKVWIGKGVASLPDYMFSNCTNVAAFYFQGVSPYLGVTPFQADAKAVVCYLPGTGTWGATLGGLPTLLWNPRPQTGPSLGVSANGFGFAIAGTSNLVVVVETCTNLAQPLWVPVATNGLTAGSASFRDPQWTNRPRGFFRLRSP